MGADAVADYRRARRMLGVVPQELVFDPFFTVRETLRIQSGYFGIRGNDAWIDEVMQHLDLSAKADANMRSLSGGMKRRVLIAQALVHKPPVIVLDEPTAGVDVELRQGLWQFVRRLNRDGHTIVLTTHYLEEAELALQPHRDAQGGTHRGARFDAQPARAASPAPEPSRMWSHATAGSSRWTCRVTANWNPSWRGCARPGRRDRGPRARAPRPRAGFSHLDADGAADELLNLVLPRSCCASGR